LEDDGWSFVDISGSRIVLVAGDWSMIICSRTNSSGTVCSGTDSSETVCSGTVGSG